MYFLMDFIKSNFVCLREEMNTHVWCLRGKGGVEGVRLKRGNKLTKDDMSSGCLDLAGKYFELF